MEQTIKVLVDAGKASAGPPLGPALGPSGVNVGQVVGQINDRTKEFTGMKVPVEVTIDPKTKEFEIKVGSPPASQLIMGEIGKEKLSSNPKFDKVGNLAIEQVIKIAKSKIDSMNCFEMKSAVKTVVGSCNSVGVMVEGKEPKEAIKEINDGVYDEAIKSGRTDVSAEKKAELESDFEEAKKELEEELEEIKKEEEADKAAEEAAAPAEEKEEGEAVEEEKEGEAKPEAEEKKEEKPEEKKE